MTDADQRALVGISLLAAFSDGTNSDPEREHIRQLLSSFKNPAINGLELYREVLMRRLTLPDLAAQITSREAQLLAYEMALGVCEADGRLNDTESAFLQQLREALRIDAGSVGPLHRQADDLADGAVPPPLGVARAEGAVVPAAAGADGEVQSVILNHAILAGALELLPSSLATMAIIPLQMRLVYRIGQRHGHSLDRKHLGEFLAAAGIGMTAQVLEGYAAKFMKGLLGKVGGGLGRGLAGAVTGSAMSFATTWALGQLAQRYYAGGRTLTGGQLQEGFRSLLGQARGLQEQYLPQIQQRSQGLSLAEVVRWAGRS